MFKGNVSSNVWHQNRRCRNESGEVRKRLVDPNDILKEKRKRFGLQGGAEPWFPAPGYGDVEAGPNCTITCSPWTHHLISHACFPIHKMKKVMGRRTRHSWWSLPAPEITQVNLSLLIPPIPLSFWESRAKHQVLRPSDFQFIPRVGQPSLQSV